LDVASSELSNFLGISRSAHHVLEGSPLKNLARITLDRGFHINGSKLPGFNTDFYAVKAYPSDWKCMR
jgi:hypothetical protein